MSNPNDKTDASHRDTDELTMAVQWFIAFVVSVESRHVGTANKAANQLRRLGWAVRRTSKQEQGSDT